MERWIMTRLYLMRHAQTADTQRFHGSESDIGLSEWGHEQSRLVAGHFKGLPIKAIYSSAMKRAVSTAAPIGMELGLVPQQVPALHERSMGALAGADRSAFRHVYMAAMSAWSSGDMDHTHETAESFRMMRDRGVPALVELLNRHQATGDSIVVVSHGMLIRVLLASLIAGMPIADLGAIKIDNVAVNELIWYGQWLEPIRLYDLPDELHNPPEDKPFW